VINYADVVLQKEPFVPSLDDEYETDRSRSNISGLNHGSSTPHRRHSSAMPEFPPDADLQADPKGGSRSLFNEELDGDQAIMVFEKGAHQQGVSTRGQNEEDDS